MDTTERAGLKPISLDVDGVIAIWPFGLNPGVSPRQRTVAALPPDADRAYEHSTAPSRLRHAIEWLRFAWRGIDPDAVDALRGLSANRRIVLTTGRSDKGRAVLQGWLDRHSLAPYIDDVYMSPGGLSTRQHKLAILQREGIDEHVDDDPTAIRYLAANGITNLYFRTWPHTAASDLPPGVGRIHRLTELLDLIE